MVLGNSIADTFSPKFYQKNTFIEKAVLQSCPDWASKLLFSIILNLSWTLSQFQSLFLLSAKIFTFSFKWGALALSQTFFKPPTLQSFSNQFLRLLRAYASYAYESDDRNKCGYHPAQHSVPRRAQRSEMKR